MKSTTKKIEARLEHLRGALKAERISYDELHELQCLGEAGHIPKHDVELREAAGLPEFPEPKAKHTPGEWRVFKELSGISILADDRLLAFWDMDENVASPIDDEDCANIALMASAPKLLEALKSILECNHRLGAISRPVADQARTAIAKATGKD